MISIATYQELQQWGTQERAIKFSAKAHLSEGKTAFLSYSSKDKSLVPGAVLILENHGGKVYVDELDPTLPESDCKAIAAHLRQAIHKTKKLIVLASPRSADSRWIPWELGLGDGIHNPSNVALFPSAESAFEMTWSEREYLGLYRRIVYGDHESYKEKIWMVIDHQTNQGVSLASWLE